MFLAKSNFVRINIQDNIISKTENFSIVILRNYSVKFIYKLKIFLQGLESLILSSTIILG